MSAATSDACDARKPSLVSYADIDTGLVERADRARREGVRYVPPAGAADEDIEAALRAEGLLDADREQIRRHFPDPEGHYRFSTSEGWLQEHQWLVVNFSPRLHEKVGKGCIESGWVFYCPKTKNWQDVKHPKKGQPRRIPVERSLFGTYGFLRPIRMDNPDWLALDHIDGLGRYLRRPITKEPVTVPMGEVEKVAKAEADGEYDETRSRPPKVRPADAVLIKTGPFAGLRGHVGMTTGERVRVLLDMLGAIDLSMDDVEVV